MPDTLVIVKVTDVSVPEAGTLPVPVQPVQTYCVPAEPGMGEVTDSTICVPDSNQPFDGEGESYREVIER
jgi:hypothetical protein